MIRECLVCGKEFEACNTCLKGVSEDLQWRRVVCCREHFAYHMPIIQYVRKMISKDEARMELQKAIDSYGTIKFCDNVKGVVADILNEIKSDAHSNINTPNKKK